MATGNHLLDQNAEGKLFFNGNELKVVSTIAQGDAAFVKVIAPYVEGESGGGGGFSIDAGDEGRNIPLVELLGAMYRGGAEGKIVVLKEGAGSNPEDRDYLTVMEFTSNGVVFRVPVSAPNLGGGGESARFFANYPGTRLCFQPQADPASLGNIVVYDTKNTADESQWVAIGYHKMTKL